MYSIYFDNRIIQVCNQSETTGTNPNAVMLHSPNDKTLGELPCLFEKSQNIRLLQIIPAPDKYEETFSRLCSCFTPINAGGGLVQNEAGEYLLIHRNGLWDLPKGKQEEGEEISLTALREVEEECGLGNLEQGELLCITRHTYHMHGLHMLKHTYWYRMKFTGNGTAATPQVEEGISECRWVPASELPEYLKNTYPSIRQVFIEAGLLDRI